VLASRGSLLAPPRPASHRPGTVGWVICKALPATSALAGCVLLLCGCGGGAGATQSRALVRQGAAIVGQSGCLACHKIGSQGNDGPGPTLTTIGAKLTTAGIRTALDDSRPPMPSYQALPAQQATAVVAYLAALKGPRHVIPAPDYLAPHLVTIPKRVECGRAYYQMLVKLAPLRRAQIARLLRKACGPAWKQ
jgi:mono/diheme cytochrome c family protein